MPLHTAAGLASLLLLLAAFYGLGLCLLQALRVRVTALDGVYAIAGGWGALVTLSIIAAYASIPFSLTLYCGLIAGSGVLMVGIWRRKDLPPLAAASIAIFSVLPAVVWAASFASVQFDEFSHWLPNAFYLFSNDTLPSHILPNLQTGKQGYPIGIPYISFAISVIEGTWDESTAKALPLVLAALFAILLAASAPGSDRPGMAAIAVAGLCATLLSPFFDPRLAITTYSDIPTAFLLAAMVYALWRAIDDRDEVRGWAVRAALTALALAQLRETNIGLVLAAALSLPLATLLAPTQDGRAADSRRYGTIGLAALAASLSSVLIWRLHLRLQGIEPDMVPRALAEWNWSAPRLVLQSLLMERLLNNPVAGVAAIAIGLGLPIVGAIGWLRSPCKTRRLLVIVAMVSAAQIGLLAFSYVAVFSEEEVTRAASAWRYASQLGPLFILATALVLPWHRLSLRDKVPLLEPGTRLASCLIVGAVAATQLLFGGRWRIDCTYPHVRPGYEALLSLFAEVPPQSSIAVINAGDSMLFRDAARLARIVATEDWQTRNVTIVHSADTVSNSEYVIDLTRADPELFRKGQTSLHATMHRNRLSEPPIHTVLISASCQAADR